MKRKQIHKQIFIMLLTWLVFAAGLFAAEPASPMVPVPPDGLAVVIKPASVSTATGTPVTLHASLVSIVDLSLAVTRTANTADKMPPVDDPPSLPGAFIWNMGDNLDLIAMVTTVTYTYTVPGTYNVTCKYSGAATGHAVVYVTGNPVCAPPVVTPPGNVYTQPVSVTITCETPGSTIRYTTNNTDPTQSNGSTYSAPILISTTTTLKARAYAPGMTESAVNTRVYTITGTVASPVITPSTGIFRGNTTVSISCATPGASIYYSIAGTINQNNVHYTAPFTLANGKFTVSAYATKTNWQTSNTAASVIKTTGQNSGGYLDGVNANTIWGWAWQPAWPNDPIDVHLYVDGQFKAAVSANQYRADLQTGGIGNGYHAFNYAMDWTLYPKGNHQVTAYAVDGSNVNPVLTGSPKTYTVGDYVCRITASDRVAGNMFGWASAVYGDYAAVGDPVTGNNAGAVYIYKRQNNAWVQIQKITSPNPSEHYAFGYSLALENDCLVIGSPGDGSAGWIGQGAVYIYRLYGSSWYYEQRLAAADGFVSDNLGRSVLKKGSRIFTGAPARDNRRGAVYVFNTVDGYNYYQEAQLIASATYLDSYFGNALACYNDTLVVGSYNHNGGTGAAFIYKYSASWYLHTTLYQPEPYGSYQFGTGVAVNSTHIVVISGYYICFYNLNGKFTSLKQKNLSNSVSLDGNNLIVGNMLENITTLYKYNGADWVNTKTLTPPQILNPQAYGRSVCVSGNFMIAGASSENDCGAAYLYNLLQL